MRRILMILAAVMFGVVVCAAQETNTVMQARNALDTDLRALREKGEPVSPDDLPKPPPLDDKDNAAVMLRQAAEAVDITSEVYSQADSMEIARPPAPDQVLVLVQIAAKNPKTLRLVASAVDKKVDWVAAYRPPRQPGGPPPIVVKSPLVEIFLPHLANMRMLANTLQFCSLAAHATGDDAEALKHVHETLFVARAVDEPPSAYVSHLVAIGIYAMAADEVGRIALDMAPEQGDGVRQQSKQLIADLLDETHSNEALLRAMRFERIMQLDTTMLIADGKLTDNILNGWLPKDNEPITWPENETRQRVALVDGRIMAEYTGKVIAAISDDWPATKAKLPAIPDRSPEHPFVRLLLPSLEKVMRQHFVGLAHRRLAAVALAIRLYAHDHNGELPPDLPTLVPAYLPAVPLDPLAAANSPMKYDRGQALVHSIGIDGVNAKGTDRALTQKLR